MWLIQEGQKNCCAHIAAKKTEKRKTDSANTVSIMECHLNGMLRIIPCILPATGGRKNLRRIVYPTAAMNLCMKALIIEEEAVKLRASYGDKC